MIRTTPFHDRTTAANETGLWEHWSGYLVAQKYQLSEKFEYFAIRNSAGLFNSSPLYKYRIHGPDAAGFLAGFQALVGRQRVTLEDVSEDSAVLSIQGPRSRDILGSIAPQVCDLPYFGLTTAKFAGTEVMVSR